MAEDMDGLAAAAWRASPQALLVVDATGAVVSANPAAAAALGGSPTATLTGALEALVSPRSGTVADALEAGCAGGWCGEVCPAAGGPPAGFWELRLVPLDPPSDPARLLGLLRDLRADRDRERARAELLSTVLHDVKGPLTVIMGYAELLCDPSEEPTREAFLDTLARIAECGEQIHALVSNFGLHSRIETDRLPADRRPVDLREIVERLGEQFTARAARKSVTFAVEGGPVPEVPGDRTQVERALANLLGNAVKFTPAGGRVSLRLAHDDAHVLLTVQDTGPGIAGEDLEAVFAKYRGRGPGRRGEGAGLGLAVARGIARAHGGELDVASTPGAGAIFTLRLPRAAPGPAA